jgi:spore maturation protein CgeB
LVQPTLPTFESSDLKEAFQETLSANLKALEALSGNNLASALNCLLSSQSQIKTSISLGLADDKSVILTINSAAQDSRRQPMSLAKKFIAQNLQNSPKLTNIWLFGLSSPATVKAALGFLARRAPRAQLTAYEPNIEVVLAFLGSLDFSDYLAKGRLRIVQSSDLSSFPPPKNSPILIKHPPSARRESISLAGLERFLFGARKLVLDPIGSPSILIVPPYSGGSEYMGASLARAAKDLRLRCKLINWPYQLRAAAQRLIHIPDALMAKELFAASAALVAREALVFSPSIMLALAQAPLDASGIGQIRQMAPKTLLAFWFVEDFQRFGYVNEVAPAYDMFFHIQGDLLAEKILKWGLDRAWYLPAATDESVFRPGPIDPLYGAKVSLMGAGYPNRRHLLLQVAEHFEQKSISGRDFKIFGSGWEKAPELLTSHLFEGGRRVSQAECVSIYRSSAINLNIHSGNGDSFDTIGAFVNPRTFEVASCGGFQIVDQRDLLSDLFPKSNLAAIDNPKDLIPMIEEYLAAPEKRAFMAKEARKTVLSQHTYRHRLEAILKWASF